MGHRARIAYWALSALAAMAVAWTLVALPAWPQKRSIKRPQGTNVVITRAPIIDPAAIRAAVARHPLVRQGLKPGARAFVDGRWPLQTNIRLAAPVPVPPDQPAAKSLKLWEGIDGVPTDWGRR